VPGGAQQRGDPLTNDASKSRNFTLCTSRNTQHTVPVHGKGVAPLSCTPTMENELVLHSPARPQFTVSESEGCATKRRSQLEAYNQHDITATTHITEHFSSRRTQNTSSNASISSINDASTRRKSPSEPHETPNMQYQYARREWRPFHVRPWMEDGLRHSIFLPDNSLRYRKLKSTRRRGGVDGKEMVHHTENTLQEVTILNHAITTNTTHSSEPIFHTRHKLPLTQPADIAARHLREGRRGDASGCQWRLDGRERALTQEASTSKPRALHVLPIQYICTSCSALPTSDDRTGGWPGARQPPARAFQPNRTWIGRGPWINS
jgi:hypothetical protein